jgi:hypothetical protein
MIQTIKINGHEFMLIQNWICYWGVWVDRNIFFDHEIDMGWWMDEYIDYVSENESGVNNVDQQHG